MSTDPWVFASIVAALLSLLRFRRACRDSRQDTARDVQAMRKLLIHAQQRMATEGKLAASITERFEEIAERLMDVQASMDELDRRSREPVTRRAADPQAPPEQQGDVCGG